MNRITSEISAILLAGVLLVLSPVLLADIGELLKQFGLPATATLADVERQYSRYLRIYEEGNQYRTYYTSLYKKIVGKFSRRPKKRLFLGEGSFSFAAGFLFKHPKMAPYIVATEFDTEDKVKTKHGKDYEKNRSFLQNLNIDVRFEVDATRIDEKFRGQRFKRIHFNFPYTDESVDSKNRKLVEEFFRSASQLQQPGDKIYMALPQPQDRREARRRQGMVYAIYSACTKSGYRYVAKRQFSREYDKGRQWTHVWQRYPGYKHVETKGSGSAAVAKDSREFIFVKTDLLVPGRELVEEEVGILRGFCERWNDLSQQILDLNAQIEKRDNRLEKWCNDRKTDISKWKEKPRTEEQKEKINKWNKTISDHKKQTSEMRVSKDKLMEEQKLVEQEFFNYCDNMSKKIPLLDLVRDLASYGPKPSLGFKSKFLFKDNYCISGKMIEKKPGNDEENTITWLDALNFLFDENFVIYNNIGYKNSAFYPLPDLPTDDDSSDVSEDPYLDQAKKESLEEAQSSGEFGPHRIDGWRLHDVAGDGNCFYRAFAHQLQLLGHPFINEIPLGTKLHHVLRSRVQRERFADREWVEHRDILALARELDVIVAIVDTRYPRDGFLYHYTENGEPRFARSEAAIRDQQRDIVRLAYTGNHYLSVESTYNLEPSLQVLTINQPVLQNRRNSWPQVGSGLFMPNLGSHSLK